ncbi:MAG: restriction endonuclease subunit S [Chitinophagaceae bacterium]|nr:restriction endonuclease subunit S [Chitinophagaceae bacterium]
MSEAIVKDILGNVSFINMGQSPDSIYYNEEGNGLPLIQGNADIKDRKSIKRFYTSQITKVCNEGDILLTVRAPVGYIGVATYESCVGRGVCSIKANGIDSKYLFYLLIQNEDNWKTFEAGTTFSAVTSKEVYNFPLLLIKSKTEQQRIAKILSTADAVIEKTQAAIAKYKAIKQGMLQDLFTRGIDLQTGKLRPCYEDAPELYKESKLGWIPREWDCDTLENLTDKVGSGVTPTGGSEVYKTQGILFLRSQNILYGKLSLNDVAFIPNEIDETMENSRVRPFDVLLNITGASIGRSAYFPEELVNANVNQHVCIIRFKKPSKSIAVFASEYLNTDFGQRQMYKAMAVGNREGLNYQQIKAFNFPDIKNQEELEKIASIIESINNKLQIEQTYLQKIQSLKKGLMEDLLSGRKRVKVAEELITQNDN